MLARVNDDGGETTSLSGQSPFAVLTVLPLGLVLVASWAFARWRPHPALFLADSLGFAAMAVYLVLDVFKGRSQGWLLLVALLLWLVVTGLRHFLRFRRTRIAQPDAPKA